MPPGGQPHQLPRWMCWKRSPDPPWVALPRSHDSQNRYQVKMMVWTYAGVVQKTHPFEKKTWFSEEMGVSPIELLPFKYSHFPLNHDYGRKSRGEINTHHMFFKVTTTRRKHLLWQSLAFFQIQLDVYIYIFIAPKVSKHGTCENSSHFESRDCFLFPFSVGLKQQQETIHIPLRLGNFKLSVCFRTHPWQQPQQTSSQITGFPWLIPESLRAGTQWTSHMQEEEQNLSH